MAATIVRRETVRVLTYPGGFTHAAHNCAGCRGEKGDCTAAVPAMRDTVFMSDGKNVVVAVGATDAEIAAALALKYP